MVKSEINQIDTIHNYLYLYMSYITWQWGGYQNKAMQYNYYYSCQAFYVDITNLFDLLWCGCGSICGQLILSKMKMHPVLVWRNFQYTASSVPWGWLLRHNRVRAIDLRSIVTERAIRVWSAQVRWAYT